MWRCENLAEAVHGRAPLTTYRQIKVVVPPATSRHPNHSLPLLPSGPGGVCKLSSRENRRDHRRKRSYASGIHSAHPVPRPAGGFAVQIGSCRFVEPVIFHFAGSNPHPSCYKIWRRERDSNPRSGITRLHTFQACSFNHSDTSPYTNTFSFHSDGGIVRPSWASPLRCAQSQPATVQIRSRRICRTCRGTTTRLHVQACSFNHSDTSATPLRNAARRPRRIQDSAPPNKQTSALRRWLRSGFDGTLWDFRPGSISCIATCVVQL